MVIKLCDSKCVCCDKHDIRFAHYSTCHGFSRVCNTWHIGRRIFWALLIAVAMLALALQLSDRFQQFMKFEVRTEVSVQNVAKYPLPAVTICNMNMFTRSKLNSLDYHLLNISSGMINWILKVNQKTFFGRDIPKNATDIFWEKVELFEQYEKLILKVFKIENFTVDTWIYNKGWQLNNTHPLLIECSVGKVRCTVDDFKPVLTPQGLCYTLNHEEKPKFWQKSPGSEAGFNILLDIDLLDYTAYKLDSEKQFECGVKVLLHEWHDYLYTGTNLAPYVGVPPGVVGYLATRPQERTLMYEPPWINCDRNELNPKRSCLARCTAEDTLAKCKCRLWFESGDAPLCGVARTTACLVFKETTLPSMAQASTATDTCHTKCLSACKERSFRVSSSYTLLTSNNTAEEFAEYINMITEDQHPFRYSPEYIQRNFISLQIAYPDLAVDNSTSSPALTTSAFLSDIGGQLGLFAGISIVTIAELLEYPLVKVYTLFKMNQRRKNKARDSSSSTTSSHQRHHHQSEFSNFSVTSITDETTDDRYHNRRSSVQHHRGNATKSSRRNPSLVVRGSTPQVASHSYRPRSYSNVGYVGDSSHALPSYSTVFSVLNEENNNRHRYSDMSTDDYAVDTEHHQEQARHHHQATLDAPIIAKSNSNLSLHF